VRRGAEQTIRPRRPFAPRPGKEPVPVHLFREPYKEASLVPAWTGLREKAWNRQEHFVFDVGLVRSSPSLLRHTSLSCNEDGQSMPWQPRQTDSCFTCRDHPFCCQLNKKTLRADLARTFGDDAVETRKPLSTPRFCGSLTSFAPSMPTSWPTMPTSWPPMLQTKEVGQEEAQGSERGRGSDECCHACCQASATNGAKPATSVSATSCDKPATSDAGARGRKSR